VSTEQSLQANNTSGLGAMLRHAREAAGLSQAELARQLNLGARIVDAMEQENLQVLPAAVYVHGYLRKWADFLRLDELQLQQAYARLAGEQGKSDMRHSTPIEPMRMKKAGTSNFPWFKLLLILGLIGLGIYSTRFLPESMRWVDTGQESSSALVSSSAEMQSVTASILPSIPLMPPPEAKPAITPAATTPGIVVGEALPSVEHITQSSATHTTSSSAPPIAPTNVAQGLELIGQGNEQGSWVRVKDADAHVLFEGIVTPGNGKKLDGKRPFEITIGRASDLMINMDGQSIDLKTYARPGGKAFIPKLGEAATSQNVMPIN